MKFIVNRGFNNTFSRIVVFKNAQRIMVCPMRKDYCEFDAKEGDNIVIKLKYLDTYTMTIASFAYHEGKEIFYAHPTKMCKLWELANFKILPYLSLLFLVLQTTIKSDAYDWFCAGIIVLTALSLLCFQYSMLISYMRKRLFKVDIL